MKKIIAAIFLFLFLQNCTSLQNKVVGVWKLTAEINSENPYANRSSLKSKDVISDKKIYLNKDSTFSSNLNLCNEWKLGPDYISKGIYHYKKKNPDQLFWLKCNGMYPDIYFKLNDKKLELYYPSVTGYRIQIFEKETKK
ncbi:hypothetical protein [Chryseobacterium kwangjuense]|uniref:Lipocalin-like domain-containing protein n=1 Tax=Chryseobacterium kwangjuense TaxID=267125 RepID=A0A135WIK0_9FLAO|nr:hypothetical protein [Chryseobacterium kwangjuense]KXH84700.1 hypothetical protein AU378_02760 [Chryseobacterium kwangjuense]